MDKNFKIGLIASSGGHWEELMCLKPLDKKYETFYVTEAGGQASNSNIKKIYTFSQINRREKGFILHFINLFIQAYKITSLEKPKLYITTGALISFPFCVIAKIKGIKIIYIESFARVTNGSLTGRLVYPLADEFLVQWPKLLSVYPKAKYIGGIF